MGISATIGAVYESRGNKGTLPGTSARAILLITKLDVSLLFLMSKRATRRVSSTFTPVPAVLASATVCATSGISTCALISIGQVICPLSVLLIFFLNSAVSVSCNTTLSSDRCSRALATKKKALLFPAGTLIFACLSDPFVVSVYPCPLRKISSNTIGLGLAPFIESTPNT